MAKITSFPKPVAKALGEQAEAALREWAEHFGLTVNYSGGQISVDRTEFVMKLTFKSATPEAADARKETFERLARQSGMDPTMFGAVFIYQGRKMTVTGILPNRPSFPIQATDQDGKVMAFRASVLDRATTLVS